MYVKHEQKCQRSIDQFYILKLTRIVIYFILFTFPFENIQVQNNVWNKSVFHLEMEAIRQQSQVPLGFWKAQLLFHQDLWGKSSLRSDPLSHLNSFFPYSFPRRPLQIFRFYCAWREIPLMLMENSFRCALKYPILPRSITGTPTSGSDLMWGSRRQRGVICSFRRFLFVSFFSFLLSLRVGSETLVWCRIFFFIWLPS